MASLNSKYTEGFGNKPSTASSKATSQPPVWEKS